MTYREFYEHVIDGTITEDDITFAHDAIAKLDKTNEARKVAAAAKAAEKAAAKAPIRDAIVGVMTNEFKTATTLIAEAGVEIKPQAMPSLMKGLVETGVVVKGEVKVTGKGKQVGYALA